MSKIITGAQAAAMVKDGCTITTTGFNGFGCPEDLMMSLADHYDQTGHPRDLRLVKCTSQGDGKGRGLSQLAAKKVCSRKWSSPTWATTLACGSWSRRRRSPAI